jgi:hypothetical protein
MNGRIFPERGDGVPISLNSNLGIDHRDCWGAHDVWIPNAVFPIRKVIMNWKSRAMINGKVTCSATCRACGTSESALQISCIASTVTT